MRNGIHYNLVTMAEQSKIAYEMRGYPGMREDAALVVDWLNRTGGKEMLRKQSTDQLSVDKQGKIILITIETTKAPADAKVATTWDEVAKRDVMAAALRLDRRLRPRTRQCKHCRKFFYILRDTGTNHEHCGERGCVLKSYVERKRHENERHFADYQRDRRDDNGDTKGRWEETRLRLRRKRLKPRK
jgi:hypothetical protein